MQHCKRRSGAGPIVRLTRVAAVASLFPACAMFEGGSSIGDSGSQSGAATRGAPGWVLPAQCAVPLPRSYSTPKAKRSHSGVQEAQGSLNNMGYDCGSPDGLIGQRTRECVKQFQRDRALPVTGILDEGTMKAIRGQ